MPRVRLPLWAVCFLATTRLFAAAVDVKVLIDSDRNLMTGCRVFTAGGTFDGADQIITTTYNGDRVTSVARQQCAGGTFTTPEMIDMGGWGVGTLAGGNVIESRVAWSVLHATQPMRLGFTVTSGTLFDAILSRPDGSPIFYPASYGDGRRRTVYPTGDHAISLNGDPTDWSGVPPIASPISSLGTPSLRFLSVFLTDTPNDLFFRFDIQANPNAPFAGDDSYTAIRGSTLTVAAPGVLINDRDPNFKTLTVTRVDGPQHGTLTLDSAGGFSYTNADPTAVLDSFRYIASNGTEVSNIATVTIAIIAGTPPSITSGNSATFTVGTPGTFTVNRTGTPAPSLGESGALPTGVTFNTSTGVLSGTPAVGTGGVYPITLTVSNAAGSANQNFTLTVNEAPSVTSANSTTFVNGAVGSFHVTTLGFPAPNITESGTLPAGVNFSGGFLSGTATTNGIFNISFTATNAIGTATQNFTLTVAQPPAFTSANATTFTAGGSGTFTVAVAGFPAPTIALTAGAPPSAVTFTSPTLSGTPAAGTGGVYTMTFTATNSAGAVNQTFTLTVNEAPAITVAATNQTVCNGSAATFTAQAAIGFPVPTVQWRISHDGGFSFTDIPGATSTTYSFTPAIADNGEVFAAVFTNAVGTAQTTAQLFVNFGPTSVANPVDVTVCPGAFVGLGVNAIGQPAPTVQWQVSTDGGATFTNIAGQTAIFYDFFPTAADNGKKYRAVFTNSCGTVPTSASTLTVNTPPVVTSNPAVQTLCAGATATFSASASGSPTPTMQWQVSVGGGPFTDISGATSATYSFATSAGDNGNQYRAAFTNACTTTNSAAAVLTVNVPPAVTTNPITQTVCAGVMTTFSAAASGGGTAVQWQVSSGGPFADIPGATSATLTFVPTSADNGKQYHAVFTNGCGTATSGNATLIVNTAPLVTTPPLTQAICSGNTVTFSAAAVAQPLPALQWQVSSGGGPFTDIIGETASTLVFTVAPAQNGNQYRAVFTNGCGIATTNAATLTVNTAPVVTTNPASHVACANTMTTFTVAATGSPAPSVQWELSTDGGMTFNPIGGATSPSYTFLATVADNLHQYRAVVTNVCNSATSAAATLTVDQPVTVTTQPAPASVPAGASVSFTAVGSGTPTVRWQVSNGGPFTDIPGATSTTYTFTAAIGDNGKQYRAVFTNTCGPVNSNAATLTVTCPTITVSTLSSLSGAFNVAYSATFNASGGAPPYTFALTGTTPPGLTLNTSSGVLSGAPASGSSSFRITATDASGCSGFSDYVIVINPIATGESYSSVGNTQTVVTGGSTASPATPFVPFTNSLLANDLGTAPLTVTSGTFPTMLGGSIVIAADGSFAYTPPAGLTGSIDTVVYTVNSNGASANATASFPLNLRIWYVQNNTTGSNAGTSTNPFVSLASAQTASVIGDTIYVMSGDGTTAHQNAGITLKNNQTLIGSGVALIIGGKTLAAAGTPPLITNIAGDGVTLANGDTVKGLTVDAATGGGVFGTGGIGTTTLDALTLQGSATNLKFDAATGTVSYVAGTISGGQAGVLIDNSSTGTFIFGTGVTITNTAGAAFKVNNSTPSVTYSGNITQNNNFDTVNITDVPTGTITFDTGTITSTNGRGLVMSNADGDVNFTGTAALSGTNGIRIENGCGGGTLAFGPNIAIGDAGTAILVSSCSANINFGGTINKTNPGKLVDIDFYAIGTLNINGAFATATNSSPAGVTTTLTNIESPVNIANMSITSSSSSFTGTLLTIGGNNPGGVMRFDHMTLSAPSTSATGLTASGGGTLAFNTLSPAGPSSITANGAALGLTNMTLAPGSTLADVTSNGSVSATIPLYISGCSGQLTISGGSISNSQIDLVTISDGNLSFTDNGTITQNNAYRVMDISNTFGGTIAFGGIVTGGAASMGVDINNVDGNVTFATLNLGTLAARMTNPPLIINGGTGTYNLGAVSIFSDGDTAIFANNADGQINSTSGIIDSINASAIDIIGPGGVTTLGMTLTTVNADGCLQDIFLSGAGGSLTINGGTLATGSNGVFGENIVIVGGSVNITDSGNITQPTPFAMLEVSGGHTGTLTFNGTLNATNGSGLQFDNADGTYNFNGTTTLNGGDAGIDILNDSAGTFTFGAGTSITNPTGVAFNVVRGGAATSNPTVNYAGTIHQTTNAALIVNIDGTTGGSVNLNGTTIGDNAASAVNITNANGNVTFGTLNLGTNGTFMTTQAVTISGGTGTYNLGAVSIGTLGVVAIGATTSGHLNSASGTINANGSSALVLSGAILGMTLTSVSSDGGTNNVSLTNTSGSLLIGGGTLSGASGASVLVSGGTVSLTDSGNITQINNADTVNITNHSAGTITFNTGTITSSNGNGLVMSNAGGTYNFNGIGVLTGIYGVRILNGSAGTIHFGAQTAITTGPAQTAMQISGTPAIVSANITFSGTISQVASVLNNALTLLSVDRFSGSLTMNGTGLGSSNSNVSPVAISNLTGSVTINNLNASSNFLAGPVPTGAALVEIGGTNTAGTTIFNHLNLSNQQGGLSLGLRATGGVSLGITDVGGGSTIDAIGPALHLTSVTIVAPFTISNLVSKGGVLATGIYLSAVSGPASPDYLTVENGSILGGNFGGPILVSGGSVRLHYSGNINTPNTGPVVLVAGHTGALLFDTGTLSGTNGTGLQFSSGANGTYTFNGTTTLSGGASVSIDGSSGTFVFGSGTTITTPASGTAAFSVTKSPATITAAGSITHNSGRAVLVDGFTPALTNGPCGSVTISAAITSGTNLSPAGTGLLVQRCNAGTVDFSGTSKSIFSSTNAGVTATDNAGATVNFSNGGLAITTTTGNGFVATAGGTVNVTTGTNPNTISSTVGVALNVTNTTIGASGLTFRSISVTGNNTLPTNGIILNNSGAGGLKVTGNAGACTPATPTCTGGTIQGTGSHGVSLTSASNIEFNLMSIHNTGDHGIFGDGVNNFILRDCRIFNFGNTAGAGISEDAMHFESTNTANTAAGHGLTGTVIIQRDNIGPDGNFSLTPTPPLPENKGIVIRNNNDLDFNMTVTGTTFLQISNDGIDADVRNDSDASAGHGAGTINVDGTTADGTNTFSQINGRAVNFMQSIDSVVPRTFDLTIKNNSFDHVGIGGRWLASGRGTMNARYNNNTMTFTYNDSIRSESDAVNAASTPHASVNATINGNAMGGGSMFISLHRQALSNIAFTNNTNIGGTAAGAGGCVTCLGVHTGINLRSDRGSSLRIDITGNTGTADGSLAFAQSALDLQATNNAGGNSTICANISGNNLTESPDTAGQQVISIDPVGGSTITIQGGPGGSPGTENFLTANNTLNGTNKVAISTPSAVPSGVGVDCVTSTP